MLFSNSHFFCGPRDAVGRDETETGYEIQATKCFACTYLVIKSETMSSNTEVN